MKNLKKFTLVGAAAVLLASCSLTRPLAVTDNGLGSKTGSSKTTCLFSMPAGASGAGVVIASGMCFNKKYGIVEAAENGGIKKVGAVDLKETNFYLFKTYELIVAGE